MIKNIYINQLKKPSPVWLNMSNKILQLHSVMGSWSLWICEENGFHKVGFISIEEMHGNIK